MKPLQDGEVAQKLEDMNNYVESIKTLTKF